ncbi:type IV pilus modification protein PilV [Thalassotalea maritima]|uniref:type IV pilus modification protein PilV n=1 Tax=Thalassotalea maritima TaxID=3242416 RepID=UPI00352836FE
MRLVSARKQLGMTLIEALVAFFILAAGILGAISMEASVKKGSFDAMQRSLASSLAQDIIERMRANDGTGSFLTAYNGTFGSGALTQPANLCNNAASLCTAAQIATADLYQWEQALLGKTSVTSDGSNIGGLVNPTGCINYNAAQVTVVISWQSRTATVDGASDVTCGTASANRRQISVTMHIY